MATVLLVDDDAGVRQIVAMILKQNGHDVLWASNGLEALMVYSSYRSRLDLVLTDVDMPQMNGIELAARIRARDPSKKILLMTGRPLDDLEGPQGCPLLAKPFGPDQLIEALEGALKA
jgi:CheY-like chemotaxis protein